MVSLPVSKAKNSASSALAPLALPGQVLVGPFPRRSVTTRKIYRRPDGEADRPQWAVFHGEGVPVNGKSVPAVWGRQDAQPPVWSRT